MKISARNALAGTITKVTRGAVNAEIDLTLKGGEKVVAIITICSADSLGLKEGKLADAIFKASSVMIAKDLRSGQLSARNVLDGKVAKVQDGAVNSEVIVKLTSGAEGGLNHHERECQIPEAGNWRFRLGHRQGFQCHGGCRPLTSTPSSSVLSVPESPNRICG